VGACIVFVGCLTNVLYFRVLFQWSEIRELTHRARRRRMLEGKDNKHVEALKSITDNDASTQSLSQV